MRNQVYKKQHPKWEQNFSVLTEIDEIEIELVGVTKVIDFTRTVFSVDGKQDYIHLVCESEEKGKIMTEVRQIFIEQTFSSDDKFLGKIDLVESKIQPVKDSEALRIFHIEDQIILLGSKAIHRFTRDDLGLLSTTALLAEEVQSMEQAKSATVINTSDADQVYTLTNLPKFKGTVPKQAWSLSISSKQNEVSTVPLFEREPEQVSDQYSIEAVSKALLNAHVHDIKIFPSLVIPEIAGLTILHNSECFKSS